VFKFKIILFFQKLKITYFTFFVYVIKILTKIIETWYPTGYTSKQFKELIIVEHKESACHQANCLVADTLILSTELVTSSKMKRVSKRLNLNPSFNKR
jgi:hypothetical protein